MIMWCINELVVVFVVEYVLVSDGFVRFVNMVIMDVMSVMFEFNFLMVCYYCVMLILF